jgi:glycine cleavage system regulatory protein
MDGVVQRFLLNGVTRLERQAAISTATQAVQDAGGWVEDAHFFSNVAVNVQCAVPAKGIDRLVEGLGRVQFGLDRNDLAPLILAASRIQAEELHFSLQITFVHDEPDLRRHVPSVPG